MPLTATDREALLVVKGLLEDTTASYTIPQLVRKSGLNADKLKKGFRYVYGMPVHRYHLEFKMGVARGMLTSGDATVDSIAAALGYNDANNFSAAFRKETGMRPGEWRQQFKVEN